MSALTLTLAAAIHLATGLVFLLLGYRLSRRPYPEGARGPGQAFAALWILFGAQSIQLALDSLMGALDAATVPIMAALYHTEILLLAAQVWALAFYVLFLISGDTSFNRLLVWFCGAFYVSMEVSLAVARPIMVESGLFGVRLAFASSAKFEDLITWLAYAPFPTLALTYAVIAARLRDRTYRLRVTMVAASIVTSQASMVIVLAPQTSLDSWWLPAIFAAALGLAWAAYYTYYPTPYLKRRYGLLGIDEASVVSRAGAQTVRPSR